MKCRLIRMPGVLACLLGAFIAGVVTLVPAPVVAAELAPALTQVCSAQGLPAGYVVTRSAVDQFSCPGLGNFRWVIEPARNNIGACFGSGYPAPYFITGINTSTGGEVCEGFQGLMTLTLPTPNMAICVNSVFWDPWVITANALKTSQCGGYGISVINRASEGLAICSNSPIPSGWTTVGGSASSQCQPFVLRNLHRVAAMSLESGPGAGHYVRSGDAAVYRSGGD